MITIRIVLSPDNRPDNSIGCFLEGVTTNRVPLPLACELMRQGAKVIVAIGGGTSDPHSHYESAPVALEKV